MKSLNPGLRKAAILVSSLDQAAADAVLDCLTPEQAGEVRRIVVDLGDVDRREQQRIREEFFRVGPLLPGKSPAGIELDDRLARRLAMRPQRETYDEPRSGRRRRAAAASRSASFATRRPTSWFACWPASGRRRLPWSSPICRRSRPAASWRGCSPRCKTWLCIGWWTWKRPIRRFSARWSRRSQSRLSEQVQMQRRRVAGLAAVAGILEASEGRTGMQILDNLARHDRALAERLGPPPLAFDDLADADASVLSAVIRSADANVLATALIGAAPEVQERFRAGFRRPRRKRCASRSNPPPPSGSATCKRLGVGWRPRRTREMLQSPKRPDPVSQEALI